MSGPAIHMFEPVPGCPLCYPKETVERLSVSLDPELVEWVKGYAMDNGLTVSAVVTVALAHYRARTAKP